MLLLVMQQRAPELGAHGDGVSKLAGAMARKLGMSNSERLAIIRAAELHDVGKMAIPDALLGKPAALDADEWALMRRHTILGERILSGVGSLAPLGKVVRASHERWDGGGYPDGLAGTEIPLAARIIFVCDAYDAMTSDRPYSEFLTPEQALTEIRRNGGSQFDPDLVEVFAETLTEVRAAEAKVLRNGGAGKFVVHG